MDGPIASAVVLPEPQELEPSIPSPTSQKRRQSSVSEQDAKRPRLNGDDDAAAATDDHPSAASNAKPSVPATGRRERGRERRLFGAALGALSQNSATAAQKRRSEIEKRQQAQRKLDEEESEQRKLERNAVRKAQRWREQKHFERDSIWVRHENLLSMAHFLRTESEPQLYYKPWETFPDEDERIRNQIADAQAIIRRELEEYESRTAGEDERQPQASRKVYAGRDAGAGHSGKDSAANGAADDRDAPTNDPDSNGDHAKRLANEAVSEERADDVQDSSTTSHAAATDTTGRDQLDENGEEVVEAAEDTVIY